jgi:outer membrane lipoprotein-sorting protein
MFRCSLIGFLWISLFLPGIAAGEDSLSTILEGIRNRYGNLPGLGVAYEREIISKSMVILGEAGDVEQASGHIYFKPPHFLRIQQETPRPELMMSDGVVLWWYIPEKNEAYKYSAQQLGEELRLLSSIFQGLREVGEDFEVSLIGRDDDRTCQLQLTPDPPWPQIQRIRLTVDQETREIRIVEIHDYVGGLTRFILRSFVLHETFEEGFFAFSVPLGARVIEEGT